MEIKKTVLDLVIMEAADRPAVRVVNDAHVMPGEIVDADGLEDGLLGRETAGEMRVGQLVFLAVGDLFRVNTCARNESPNAPPPYGCVRSQ